MNEDYLVQSFVKTSQIALSKIGRDFASIMMNFQNNYYNLAKFQERRRTRKRFSIFLNLLYEAHPSLEEFIETGVVIPNNTPGRNSCYVINDSNPPIREACHFATGHAAYIDFRSLDEFNKQWQERFDVLRKLHPKSEEPLFCKMMKNKRA